MDFSSFSPALILVTVVSLALAPFVAVMVTSFTKIVVVLSLLRNALGLQQVPPNVVINGLAIVLSIYVMYPVILDTNAAVQARMQGQPPPAAVPTSGPGSASGAQATPPDETPPDQAQPDETAPAVEAAAQDAPGAGPAEAEPSGEELPAGEPLLAEGENMDVEDLLELVEAGKEPLREFLIKHSSDAERAFFLRSAQRLLPAAQRGEVGARDFIVIVPAFTVSELTAAFQIGFLIFLPFLIIDLVVANILLALGMMMMSPTLISLPFKLLLFVLIDGWAKLVHGLVLTYG